MTTKILVATRNPGKIKEFEELLADSKLDVEWLGLADCGIDFEVEENGNTFAANAILKARQYAAAAGLLTLADDSGLEVDALDGAPGIYTARYGGEGLSHEERYRFLLKNIQGVPDKLRGAQFRAVLVVSNPEGEILTMAEGICPGRIATAPRGSYGFGYDPVFIPEGQGGKTMAELPPEQKHPISHRGIAVENIKPLLAGLIRSQQKR